jgi:hypothetical protein
MIERRVGDCGTWIMRIPRFKMMLHSYQSSADLDRYKIRPEDGLPAILPQSLNLILTAFMQKQSVASLQLGALCMMYNITPKFYYLLCADIVN